MPAFTGTWYSERAWFMYLRLDLQPAAGVHLPVERTVATSLL
jgi:hypothetical protein